MNREYNQTGLWSLKPIISSAFQKLGFDCLGAFSISDSKDFFSHEIERLNHWLHNGYNGTMSFLEKNHCARSNPSKILPNCQSAIVILCPYSSGKRVRHRKNLQKSTVLSTQNMVQPSAKNLDSLAHRRLISKYALGKDYHRILKGYETSFKEIIAASICAEFTCRLIVDSAPFFERAAAQHAGLGFIGKNTMLIRPGLGSYYFIPTLLTSLPIENLCTLQTKRTFIPHLDCGECQLCIDACPTQAFVSPKTLDARKCLSYLTIEHKGPVNNSYISHFEKTIFGCDICQEVCPYNLVTTASFIPEKFQPLEIWSQLSLVDISLMSQNDYEKWFGGTSLTRTGRFGLIRNALYSLYASKHVGLPKILETLKQRNDEPLQGIIDQLENLLVSS